MIMWYFDDTFHFLVKKIQLTLPGALLLINSVGGLGKTTVNPLLLSLIHLWSDPTFIY